MSGGGVRKLNSTLKDPTERAEARALTLSCSAAREDQAGGRSGIRSLGDERGRVRGLSPKVLGNQGPFQDGSGGSLVVLFAKASQMNFGCIIGRDCHEEHG